MVYTTQSSVMDEKFTRIVKKKFCELEPRIVNVTVFMSGDFDFEVTSGFPLDWKNGKAFSSQGGKSREILNRLEKSRKITQNTGKLREFQKKVFVY